MKKLIFLFLLIFISGCGLTTEKIANNPDIINKECDKSENRNYCYSEYAKKVSLISGDAILEICNNLDSGYSKNKCLFDAFVVLEANNRLNEGIEICKYIEKNGFLEWCESRKSGSSIGVAPSLD